MKAGLPTREEALAWLGWVGRRVRKASGKPFKSGRKTNTVVGLATHPERRNACFVFAEDDSMVECWRCELVSPEDSDD